MKRLCTLLLSVSAAALAGCASPKDTVVFVTNTSLGINVDSKPPSASIAYDRTEGYLGPRSANGGMPPVVASIQTNGNVFNPQIRQVYATGAAAVLVTSPDGTQAGPGDMTGTDDKMAFFGTTTTVGLKVGFDATGSPDSLIFGFKRKELSVIPLGSEGGKRIYPSVLASIDTTVGTSTLRDTGLTIAQYFATGKAAEMLASSNDVVRKSFTTLANNAAMAALTPAQQAAAQVDANAALGAQRVDLEKVMLDVAPAGALDTSKLSSLIDKANAARPGSVNPALKTVTTAAQLRIKIQDDLHTTSSLAAVAD